MDYEWWVWYELSMEYEWMVGYIRDHGIGMSDTCILVVGTCWFC